MTTVNDTIPTCHFCNRCYIDIPHNQYIIMEIIQEQMMLCIECKAKLNEANTFINRFIAKRTTGRTIDLPANDK